MFRLSLEGTLKKENMSIIGALLRISQALHGLVSSLEEFREVETMLGLESAAEADHRGSHDSHNSDASPNFLGVVAGTLKETVGKLVSDMEAKPEIQKLLLVIQKSVSGVANEGVFVQDATITKQRSSCLVGTLPSGEAEAVCISGMGSRTVKRAVRRAAVERAVTCRHFYEHHPQVMDPCLWRTLPQELVQLVFARLPIAKIMDIFAHFTAWSTMSRSSNFRRGCSERHPKLFGLVTQEPGNILRNIVFDIKSNEWIARDLDGFIRAFDIGGAVLGSSNYACDGGLVCFVSELDLLYNPIHVGNPLTDEWRALPCLPCLPFGVSEIIMVQLVMGEDAKCYKVILVFGDVSGVDYAAHCYDSKTGVWSCMGSGLVYGVGSISLMWTRASYPRVFDCSTKSMYELRYCSSLEGVDAVGCVVVKDHLFVLRFEGALSFKVSEYAWQSNTSDLSIINSTSIGYFPSD